MYMYLYMNMHPHTGTHRHKVFSLMRWLNTGSVVSRMIKHTTFLNKRNWGNCLHRLRTYGGTKHRLYFDSNNTYHADTHTHTHTHTHTC